MFDLLAAHTPQIAGADSGVSWGALGAILGTISTIGVAAVGALWSNQSKGFERLELKFDSAIEKLDDKVDKCESGSRSARAELWKEHRAVERRHDKDLTELKTVMTMKSSPPGNPPVV